MRRRCRARYRSIYLPSRRPRLFSTAAPFCEKGPGWKNRTSVSRKSAAIAHTAWLVVVVVDKTPPRRVGVAVALKPRLVGILFSLSGQRKRRCGCLSPPSPPRFPRLSSRHPRFLPTLASPRHATRRRAENDDRDTPSLRAAPFFRPLWTRRAPYVGYYSFAVFSNYPLVRPLAAAPRPSTLDRPSCCAIDARDAFPLVARCPRTVPVCGVHTCANLTSTITVCRPAGCRTLCRVSHLR